ncbi:MAG TPA: DoxX family protein, partial [Bryobacteraceae bacterium]|nr:DoxX family protein [Bryobacteraceae bacterium]
MQSVSKRWIWTGRVASVLAGLFLFFDGLMKVIKPAFVIQATVQLGYPENTIRPIGIILLICVIVYAIPQTSIFGAVLLTGYLGGAIATNVRVGAPLFTYILVPIYLAVLIWGGLLPRSPQLRALIS